ncbi:MAG: asparagine synthase (glutamine-hydrolyzing) [Candidatus Sabulitectum sp.]|nr:asparagine synthase (glutamine-hydrolyzing) [Candidatus Sabulitectum sp.]
MCGIAGIYGACEDTEIRLSRMAAAMARRGPDGHGIWQDADAGIGLAHTRLSIIDLSCAGYQPMTYGDKRFWITFNGEIYNYQELRRELEGGGAIFATHTDTEVILAGWARWGHGVLDRLRGMFAFAIWDVLNRSLALCRDRMGIKPLLWAEAKAGFVFGSTLKAIKESGFVEPIIEPNGIFDLLATGSVCQPGTMIRSVHSLDPGTCLLVGPGSLRESIRYWDLTGAVTALQPTLARYSYTDAVRLIRDLLDEACRYNLIADVPVGSFLSGGVDSTAITALMSRHMHSPVKSFSIGFEETGGMRHELDDARLAASYIGCDHTEIVVTGRDIEAAFDDLVSTIDQPSFDGTNTFLVSRAAGATVKVALSGLGGDELFAGYGHFALLRNAASPTAGLRERLSTMLHSIRPNRFTMPSVRVSAMRRLALTERYARLRRGLTDDDIVYALREELIKSFTPGFLEVYIGSVLGQIEDSVAQTSLVECRHYLLNTLLRDADAMSMGHGIEVRPMMLDHRLVEHSLALPSHFKLQGSRQKAILKDSVADMLPPSLLTRPKTGFTLPLGWWLRHELRPRLQTALDGKTARSIFTEAFLRNCQGGIDEPSNHRTLWTMLVLISWIDSNGIVVGG